LSSEIRFVEREQMGGASGDGLCGGGSPAVGVDRSETPEHRGVVER